MKFNFFSILILANIFLISKVLSQEIDEDEESKIDPDEKKKEEDEEKVFNNLNVYRVRSETELNYLTDLLDFSILQFFYLPYSTKSKKVAAELIKVNKDIEGLAAIVAINCDEFQPQNYKHCVRNEYSTDSFPKIRLFVSPEKRFDQKTNQVKKHLDIPYTEAQMSKVDLYNYIVTNIPNKSVKLDSFNLTPFLNSDSMNKVILFTDKKTPGVIFRGLTNNFYDKLLFGLVESTETEVLERFNIKTFPTLMVYKTLDPNELLEDPIIKFYHGNTLNVARIIEFLTPFALSEKRYLSTKRGIPEETGDDLARNIDHREINRENYIEYFLKYQDKRIMVLFHTKNKLKQSVKKHLFESQGYFLNVWFNCKGEKEFCKTTFDVDSFPTLKLFESNSFNNSTNTFTDVVTFDPSSNSTFLDGMESYMSKKSKIRVANDLSFPVFTSETKDSRKFALISIQSSTTSLQKDLHQMLPFKLLSTDPEIQKHIDFITYTDPTQKVIQDLKITKMPFLVYYYFNIDKWASIPVNPNILYSSLKTMTDNIIYHRVNKVPRKPFTSETVKAITDNQSLRYACTHADVCLIALLDAKPHEPDSIKRFNSLVERLEIIASKEQYKDISYGWVNATCHDDFNDKFSFSPKDGGLVLYHMWKETYNKFAAPIDDHHLLNFFEKVKENKFPSYQMEKDVFVLTDKECSAPVKSETKPNKTEKIDEVKSKSDSTKSDL